MPSKPIDASRWLIDISHNIRVAQSFIDGLSAETFRTNRLVFYAVTRCLEIISEASRHLPSELKERHPAIPWPAIAGARNFYCHEYGGVDQDLVWGTVEMQPPILLSVVELELKALGIELPPDD